ncbi:MAG TPA: hypothetical protein PKD54_14235 [Pirellulaceae bacterium]|nr:hypothetical protein [Pirellulaceae bacterium]
MRTFGLIAVCCLMLPIHAAAQMVGVQTPWTSVGSSHFERMGVGFGFQIPGGSGPGSRIVGLGPGGQILPHIQFGQNSFASAIPGFGGYDPNASGRLGFARMGDGLNFSMLIEMGKGNSRTLTSTAPSLVVPNGQGGYLFDGEIRPFVSGTIPVVGSALGGSLSPWERQQFAILGSDPALTGPPVRDLNSDHIVRAVREEAAQAGSARINELSTASRGARSVAAIRAERDAQQRQVQSQIATLLAEAVRCEETDDPVGARILIRRAISLETDPDRLRELRSRLDSLR